MATTITGANAIVTLQIPSLFPVPQQLQGFAADDIFDTDALESAETLMGVDGIMSAGFVFVPVNQHYSLQADSPSNFIFDTWWATQQLLQDLFLANAVVILPAIGTKWALTKGALVSYKPITDVKKLLQPRRHTIRWQTAIPQVS